jgi:dipeptidyl aminopeptidase/acylaminoacyl peptidase
MKHRYQLLGSLLGLLLGAAQPQQAGAAPASALPPLEHFFANPKFAAPKLSPNGKYLAARISAKGERDWLSVLDLDSNKVTIVAQLRGADIDRFEWVNNERLVFDSTDARSGDGEIMYGPGLYAVNRDGKGFRQLADRTGEIGLDDSRRNLQPWNTFMLHQPGPQDSDWIYVTSPIFDPVYHHAHDFGLLRLNTVNGLASRVEKPGSPERGGWLLDHQGEPRLVTVTAPDDDSDNDTIYYRDSAKSPWRKLAEQKIVGKQPDAFEPLAFGPDGTLYVVGGNDDTDNLYVYDLKAGKLAGAPLVALKGYDFSGGLIMDQHKLLGVRYTSDAHATLWFDARMKAVQQAVDALLPNTANLVTPPVRPESPWMLVDAYSDVQPHTYLVFDSDKKTLRRVGSNYGEIKPEQMGTQDLVHYKARDGLEIPAWLTLPAGKSKNLPLVVLVHGGPQVRGASWGWDPEVQFLASRGYAVLQPEYRGSTGFGDHHFRAGWKQWGLKMQDDIADGAKWAIAQGTADPRRICIAGASYGGYATLMGLINDPQLYRCGVEWAGVTDINLLYDGHWRFDSDFSERWKKFGMPELVGDQVKDAAQLKATSPLLQASRIKQPLLLAYGGSDRRVPLVHGTRFRDAVRAGNSEVEWIEYLEEGHGWYLPENRIDFWGRVEKFLARNIGDGAAK